MLKMALTNLLPPYETETYKYHILLDHLKLPSARYIALAYAHDPQPYTKSLAALDQQYGQPHHLASKEITTILNLPKVQPGDAKAFHDFAVRVQSLVGMLQAMGQNEGAAELACSSHVQHLLSKLPADLVANFIRYNRSARPGSHFTLVDFATWLHGEAECQLVAAQVRHLTPESTTHIRRPTLKSSPPTATILHGTNTNPHPSSSSAEPGTITRLCQYCKATDHSIIQCKGLKDQKTEDIIAWIKREKRCWRCAGPHMAISCNLKKSCPLCNRKHIAILHRVNQKEADSKVLYLNSQFVSPKVLLKMVKMILLNKHRTLNTYAILDDGYQRTTLLSAAREQLGLEGPKEHLAVRTIRQRT